MPKPGVVIATFFGAGYFPVGPGTAGTVAAIPLAWGASRLPLGGQITVALAVTLIGIPAATVAGRHFNVVDAKQIVIDEVAGLLITLLGVPFHAPQVIAGFILFRLFDITKPWPASYFDTKVKNGAGVVLDDVAAGMYARLCIFGLATAWPGTFGGAR